MHNEFPNYLFVPCDYGSIQEAIDVSENGDIIIVEEGIYKEEIDFSGKNITVASFFFVDGDTSHISKTVIAGKDEFSGKWSVLFTNGETSDALLTGFKIDCTRENQFHDGGGIKCIDSTPKLISLIISNNEIADITNGGGVYLEDSDATLLGVKFLNNRSSNGGGIYILNSKPVLNSLEFTGNIAENGGGIYLENSDVTISNTVFIENRSDYTGGAIYCKNSSPIIENSVFNSNLSINGSPGIYFENSNPSLNDLYISDNERYSWEGSTIKALNSNIIADKISIVNNKSNGLELNDSKLDLSNSLFSKNIIGIILGNSSTVKLTNVSITEHKEYAGSRGMFISNSEFIIDNLKCINNGPADGGIGGIGIFESTGSINNSIIANNFCGGHGEGGGGVFIKNSTVDLEYVLISDNSAFDMNGSAIYSDGADISLKNITLVNNSENIVNSGSIYNINNSKITISNSILWNNKPSNFYDTLGVTVTYSDIENGFIGEGNLSIDPQFCSPAEKKYSLQPSSPCIDVGKNGQTIGSEDVGCN